MTKILDLIKPYREYLQDERLLAKQTITAYTSDLAGLSAWWKADVSTITRNDLREYMRHLTQAGQSRATVRRKMQGFCTFFQWCEMEKHMQEDPSKGLVVPPRKKRAPRFLSIQELETFVTIEPPKYHLCNPERDRLAFRLLAWLGLRRGELLNLMVEDVKLKSGVIVIREAKNGDDRELPIPEQLKAELEAFIGERESGYLLQSHTGNQWGYNSFSLAFRRHAIKCGFGRDVTPHTLRHTLATHLSWANVPMATLQHLMGWKDANTGKHYIHHTPAMRQSAMARHPLAQGA